MTETPRGSAARLLVVTDERREWGMRGPSICPDSDDGCDIVPESECTCPPHHESDPDACGEDEAAGCHHCKHRDIYYPCPAAILEAVDG